MAAIDESECENDTAAHADSGQEEPTLEQIMDQIADGTLDDNSSSSNSAGARVSVAVDDEDVDAFDPTLLGDDAAEQRESKGLLRLRKGAGMCNVYARCVCVRALLSLFVEFAYLSSFCFSF